MELASLFLWLPPLTGLEGAGDLSGKDAPSWCLGAGAGCLAGRCRSGSSREVRARSLLRLPVRCSFLQLLWHSWPSLIPAGASDPSGASFPHHSHPASCCWRPLLPIGPTRQGPLGYTLVLCPWGHMLPRQCVDNTTSCESALSTLWTGGSQIFLL